MKLTVLQEDLSKHLNTALRFSSSKVQLPVLANILLKTDKGKLFVKATNLETSVSISMGAKIEADGEITVPARTITEIISNLKPGQINLEVDKEKIKIESAGFKSVLSGMNASDFPKITDKITSDAVEISSQTLSDALESTLFTVSTDETRPVLTGVLVYSDKQKTGFVGTDGFRLSRKMVAVSAGEESLKLILPRNAISEIVRLSKEEELVKYVFKKTDNQVVFSMGNTVLTTRIIEGEFPDFERIIPKSSPVILRMDKDDLLRAVKLAGIFAKDAANVIKMKVLKDSVEISAESSKSGTQETKVEAKVEGGVPEKLTIAFNYRFVEDFLGVTKSEEVLIKAGDPNSPALFLDPTDQEFLHIIMPIRLQE